MSEAKLDQIVKGAPPPNVSPSQIAAAASSQSNQQNLSDNLELSQNGTRSGTHTPLAPTDPLTTLPSSPPQIYLNLLILEASLRSQYLVLRARRRQHIFVLFCIAAWTVFFSYTLFLRPREDGMGFGGSVYPFVEIGEKIALMGGILTLLLIWGTGVWERGIRWPRRWVGVTNRGLRGINAKIVVLKGSWWRELLGHLWWLWPVGDGVFGVSGTPGSVYRLVEKEDGRRAQGDVLKEYSHSITGAGAAQANARPAMVQGDGKTMVEEDVESGGDYIKLLLLPKPFSPDFRENWELYRTEYWERENERRTNVRTLLKSREKDQARRDGGWLWWTGWRGWKSFRSPKEKHMDYEKPLVHSNVHHTRNVSTLKEKRRRPSAVREGSHSRSSSKSGTPTPEVEEEYGRAMRRGSGSSMRGERTRRRSGTGERPKLSRLTPSNSRPTTPTSSSEKRLGTLSIYSSDVGQDGDSIWDERENLKTRGLPPIAGSPVKQEKEMDNQGR